MDPIDEAEAALNAAIDASLAASERAALAEMEPRWLTSQAALERLQAEATRAALAVEAAHAALERLKVRR